MALSLHAFKDGRLRICDSDAERLAAWNDGLLGIATFSGEQFAALKAQFITNVGGGWMLKAAQHRPLEVEDVLALRDEIAQALGR